MLDIHVRDAMYRGDIDWSWIGRHLTANGWAVVLEITNGSRERSVGMSRPFEGSGPLAPLDGRRWIRQMEHERRLFRQAGAAANHLGATIGSLRAGGEPRRRTLANLARPEPYLKTVRRSGPGKGWEREA